MTCHHVTMPGGFRAIVCTSGRPRRKCSACKDRRADLLCDFPTPTRKSGTCDRPLCGKCAVHVGEDRDHCPSHATAEPAVLPAQGRLDL